jgi:hypothetical protein
MRSRKSASMPSSRSKVMAQVREIDACQRFLQPGPCTNVNNAVIAQHFGKAEEKNRKFLMKKNDEETPPTLISLPRELCNLTIDEVLRAPIAPPSTDCCERDSSTRPLRTVNTIPELKPTHSAPEISHVNAQLRAETHSYVLKRISARENL